jgi:5-keto 4-deoxyuronate isomerase
MAQKLKEQYELKISNRFAVLENLDASVDRTWTEWVGVVVMLLTSIWEMVGSDLSWNTSSTD